MYVCGVENNSRFHLWYTHAAVGREDGNKAKATSLKHKVQKEATNKLRTQAATRDRYMRSRNVVLQSSWLAHVKEAC